LLGHIVCVWGRSGAFVGWERGRIVLPAKCRARAPLQRGGRPVGDENEERIMASPRERRCHIHFPKLINA